MLGGKPLLNYPLATLNELDLDDIILYSNDNLLEYIDEGLKYNWVKRPKKFDGDEITFNDILDSIIDDIETDYIVFLTCTSPFIRSETIAKMINEINCRGHDSAFTAFKYQCFSWYAGRPLNYDLSNVPKTQDIVPVWVETSGLYIFSKDVYKAHHRRIGFDPHIEEVDLFEGWDIDTAKDWEIAEWILQVKDKKARH